MEATNLISLAKLPCHLFSSTTPHQRKRFNLTVAVSGETNRRDYWGRLVDKNMIVLRLRMREMKILETNYKPPSTWMEWEKQYFWRYIYDVCAAVGCWCKII
jgi:hypothetical protein